MAEDKVRLRQLGLRQRVNYLRAKEVLPEAFDRLTQMSVMKTLEQSRPQIENAVSVMPVPVGLATDFVINGRPALVPIATEERGIVAACSKAAKMCLPDGFRVKIHPTSCVTGQILYAGYTSADEAFAAYRLVNDRGQLLIKDVVNSLPDDQQLKFFRHDLQLLAPHGRFRDDFKMVVNIEFETGQKMGAGIATRLAEMIADALDPLVGRKRTAAICSNHKQGWYAEAKASWHLDDAMAQSMMRMLEWASDDPRRTPTHVKGILNAMVGVGLATGQDYRAIAVTAADAAVEYGRLGPMTHYDRFNNELHGLLRTYLPVATQGGATKNQFAAMHQRLGQVNTSQQLAAMIAAAGLAANFGALHCLVTHGLSAGHAKTR